MDIQQAQQDMDHAYMGGSTGVLVSGLVWCVAGLVGLYFLPMQSMLTLFFGGMFIHPMAMLLSKVLKRPGNHQSGNPLGKLALESTIILFVGLFLAFYVARLEQSWFYPVMMLAIGVRYLTFQTLYGNKLYWGLGAVLMLAGAFCMLMAAPFVVGAFIGGITEIVFAVVLLMQAKDKALTPVQQ